MRTNRLLMTLALLAVLLLFVTACSGGRDYLLQERFDNPSRAWGSAEEEAFTRGYDEGEYYIEVQEPDWFAWVRPGERFDDAVIEVGARRVSDGIDGHFGLLCRYREPDSFYYFAITSDGYYAILRVEDGENTVLTGDGFLRSDVIRATEEVYYIRAACQGEELSLFIAGEEVASVSDSAFARGDVGLGVGSSTGGAIRVHFDNLVVSAPQEQEGE